jgi:hypothetical protein
MKVDITITYDDKKHTFGTLPLLRHREAIGVFGATETSISKNYYPNPGDGKSLIVCLPVGNTKYIVGKVTVEDETLVNANKSNLTKLGAQLVEQTIAQEIDRLYHGEGTPNPLKPNLPAEHYAEVSYEWDEETGFNLQEVSIYRIDPRGSRKLRVPLKKRIGFDGDAKVEVKETEVKETEVMEVEVKETEVMEVEVKETEVMEVEVKEPEAKKVEVNKAEAKKTKVKKAKVKED